MGPFNCASRNKLRKEVISGAERIILRDPISVKYVKDFLPGVEVEQALDSALQHDIDIDKNERKYNNYPELKNFIENHEKCIGITITDLKWHPVHKNEKIIEQIPTAFKAFITQKVKEGYSRHSMRQFESKSINIEDVEKAIKIAQKAPTACNRQASKVYLYKDKATNDALGELIAGNTGFQQEVPNYLVVTADVSAFYDTFERNQVYVEAGLFSMALVEALHYYGIGSCILQNGEYYKKNKKFKEICKNIPENERIILFVATGYYKNKFSYAMSLRKNVEDVFIVK